MLALLIGIPLAFGLVRGRFRGRALIENGISAPIIVPHIVLSIAIYGLFSRLGLIGEWYGIAVAHTVLALPFVVIVLLSGLRDFDTSLELAARGLGAGPIGRGAHCHAAYPGAERLLGGVPRLHHLVRRTGGSHVHFRRQHDVAEEDVRQHHE